MDVEQMILVAKK